MPTGSKAREEAAQRREHRRSDWFDANTGFVDQILEAKFAQNAGLEEFLLDTGSSEIHGSSSFDSFWGIGMDRMGPNGLSKL
ncbi:uncharacterized protein PHACADRAFT_198619 [Phanerochaete carnosa HHB-10118-sp]|uniref:NADAR domain-containing protein n=1 Tax=Phanerochaete carnosa (strain HHB-10118-sp) TaxID=650164 RepID=K5W0Z8_PHACS|nr:uncharacterized protein PHACADRAFT_198619 [Phanerochaete carnosa HHB-10118-sp]EKM52564.1 hypothetical protein PHACADRAFT_198619 [Phanerochaete carnosa HHB-10118-sp]